MLNISGIQEGIVLDHIQAGRAMEIYYKLGMDKLDCTIAIIMNAKSNKMGRKDIIKIDADIPVNFDVIGYVDPGVSINIIRNGMLIEKRKTHFLRRPVLYHPFSFYFHNTDPLIPRVCSDIVSVLVVTFLIEL